jgi:pimeloyl-ACP methyl ester carboxylesterase
MPNDLAKRTRSIGIGAACAMLVGACAAAAEQETSPANPAARSQRGDFEFQCHHRDRPIQVFGYRPAGYSDGPLLVLFHGAARNAKTYRDGARKLAEKLGMLLVVPEFDRARFDVSAYQEGGVMKKGKIQPMERWTFSYLPPLLEQVFEREGRRLPYHLVGHSAGAQFLGRMAALYPNEARRMVLVNPGSLLFPDPGRPYPHGFGGLPEEMRNDGALRRYLASPVTLYLGTGDVGMKDLPTGEGAMKQGPTRIARGRNCHEAAKGLAASRQWDFTWHKVEAEGLEHASGPMWDHPNCRLAILGDPLAGEEK